MKDVSFITATEDWGIVRYWALCNAPDGGYLYAVGDVDRVLGAHWRAVVVWAGI